jgi:hypothetical protein
LVLVPFAGTLMTGAAGAVVSMITVRVLEAGDVSPLTVSVALKVYVPSARLDAGV